MKAERLGMDGTWLLTPKRHTDRRGDFLEWYQADNLARLANRAFSPAQGNLSVSKGGVVRGIHFADVPPGQAKYVMCVSGAVQDVVVDLRVGSPTFGRSDTVTLDDQRRCGLYVSEGLGHGFCALTDEATVVYLTSTAYDPDAEHTLNPLDPVLGIEWVTDDPILSPRDAGAPTLAELEAAGRLPRYADSRVAAGSVTR